MASYDVALTSSAEKELKKLSGQWIARIVPRLENLTSNPRPSASPAASGERRATIVYTDAVRME
jgi:mRNA-degrading endonuclease RelE of RelBE toxin-antitoxin system